MKNRIKTIIPKRLIPVLEKIRHGCLDCHALKSYSQEGEDMILRRIFEKKTSGFYVDVGAHHPKRFSNTYFFYNRGWHGINIDAMPGSMNSFNTARSKDINIECGVSEIDGNMKYYIFNDPALNGFSRQLSELRHEQFSNYRIIGTREVLVKPLSSILDEYLPSGQSIDFLSVDVEGLDLQVLRSNNWDKYRPLIVLAEVLNKSLCDIPKDPVSVFLEKKGYSIYAKCVNTIIYRLNV